ncbi:uncharacterized protein LOC108892858 isoform X2 [Lates calcarifer]|uniref:Uncharacterized protein LOC108892858 isoform X2 n=1 Tax=Lates calcarifer TaxID=8187 RepID=A0AAJ8AX91_LATCA|nr:uncharacterized protein LOC108892858 isoform X2 [Lates calcarifer]
MTGAFHSVPIMRPYYCWTVLYVSILAALVLTLNADSKTSECETSIKVRRNTVYQAFVGQDLRINCTVSFCNNTQPVSWFKLENGTDSVSVNKNSHIKTEWKPSDHLEGTSYLIFQKILSNDSGVYRCRSGGSVSHNINILVSGKTSECETSIKVRRNTVYQAFVGQDLRINCTVSFCNNIQPVSWFKLENGTDSVSVNKNSHIKTEWKPSDHLEGTSYLIFQKILSNDSGVYRCQSGGSESHNINILVSGKTSECETSIKVRRNTVYKTFVGQDLRINCTVSFCNNIQPVSWFKLENGTDSVSVNKNSHIKTEWKPSDHLEGTSYLIFQKILSNDSGVYRCRSGGSESHSIKVLVYAQDTFWSFVYRVVGIMVFVIIVIAIYVTPKRGSKGVCCVGGSKTPPDPPEPSCPASSNSHIYENNESIL